MSSGEVGVRSEEWKEGEVRMGSEVSSSGSEEEGVDGGEWEKGETAMVRWGRGGVRGGGREVLVVDSRVCSLPWNVGSCHVELSMIWCSMP